jgi:hypothetical protein
LFFLLLRLRLRDARQHRAVHTLQIVQQRLATEISTVTVILQAIVHASMALATIAHSRAAATNVIAVQMAHVLQGISVHVTRLEFVNVCQALAARQRLAPAQVVPSAVATAGQLAIVLVTAFARNRPHVTVIMAHLASTRVAWRHIAIMAHFAIVVAIPVHVNVTPVPNVFAVKIHTVNAQTSVLAITLPHVTVILLPTALAIPVLIVTAMVNVHATLDPTVTAIVANAHATMHPPVTATTVRLVPVPVLRVTAMVNVHAIPVLSVPAMINVHAIPVRIAPAQLRRRVLATPEPIVTASPKRRVPVLVQIARVNLVRRVLATPEPIATASPERRVLVLVQTVHVSPVRRVPVPVQTARVALVQRAIALIHIVFVPPVPTASAIL